MSRSALAPHLSLKHMTPLAEILKHTGASKVQSFDSKMHNSRVTGLYKTVQTNGPLINVAKRYKGLVYQAGCFQP